MKKIARIFILMVMLSLVLTGCQYIKNITGKVAIPKHEPLQNWEITAEKYIEQLEYLLENYYTDVSIERVEQSETSRGSKSEYSLTDKDEKNEYVFCIDILCNTEEQINQIMISAYNDLSEKSEKNQEEFFENYTSYCINASIMALTSHLDFSDDVKKYSETLVTDGYILELNIKYEMIDNRSLGINGYISPINGGFKISDIFGK